MQHDLTIRWSRACANHCSRSLKTDRHSPNLMAAEWHMPPKRRATTTTVVQSPTNDEPHTDRHTYPSLADQSKSPQASHDHTYPAKLHAQQRDTLSHSKTSKKDIATPLDTLIDSAAQFEFEDGAMEIEHVDRKFDRRRQNLRSASHPNPHQHLHFVANDDSLGITTQSQSQSQSQRMPSATVLRTRALQYPLDIAQHPNFPSTKSALSTYQTSAEFQSSNQQKTFNLVQLISPYRFLIERTFRAGPSQLLALAEEFTADISVDLWRWNSLALLFHRLTKALHAETSESMRERLLKGATEIFDTLETSPDVFPIVTTNTILTSLAKLNGALSPSKTFLHRHCFQESTASHFFQEATSLDVAFRLMAFVKLQVDFPPIYQKHFQQTEGFLDRMKLSDAGTTSTLLFALSQLSPILVHELVHFGGLFHEDQSVERFFYTASVSSLSIALIGLAKAEVDPGQIFWRYFSQQKMYEKIATNATAKEMSNIVISLARQRYHPGEAAFRLWVDEGATAFFFLQTANRKDLCYWFRGLASFARAPPGDLWSTISSDPTILHRLLPFADIQKLTTPPNTQQQKQQGSAYSGHHHQQRQQQQQQQDDVLRTRHPAFPGGKVATVGSRQQRHPRSLISPTNNEKQSVNLQKTSRWGLDKEEDHIIPPTRFTGQRSDSEPTTSIARFLRAMYLLALDPGSKFWDLFYQKDNLHSLSFCFPDTASILLFNLAKLRQHPGPKFAAFITADLCRRIFEENNPQYTGVLFEAATSLGAFDSLEFIKPLTQQGPLLQSFLEACSPNDLARLCRSFQHSTIPPPRNFLDLAESVNPGFWLLFAKHARIDHLVDLISFLIFFRLPASDHFWRAILEAPPISRLSDDDLPMGMKLVALIEDGMKRGLLKAPHEQLLLDSVC